MKIKRQVIGGDLIPFGQIVYIQAISVVSTIDIYHTER